MKRHLMHLMVLLAVLWLPATATATPPDPTPDTASIEALQRAATQARSPEQWSALSIHLVDAMHSDHDALQAAAMRLIIQYGENVEVGPAVFDVAKIYRSHPDDDMRRMAVVALGNMDSRWAMGFLRLSLDYEQSPKVLHTMRAVLAEAEVS